jgi:hypothetical protein
MYTALNRIKNDWLAKNIVVVINKQKVAVISCKTGNKNMMKSSFITNLIIKTKMDVFLRDNFFKTTRTKSSKSKFLFAI